MNFESVEKIAAAILYEGYILYPYRPTAVKNRQRWNFGTLYPQFYAEAQRPVEPFWFVAEGLALTHAETTFDVKIRALQLTRAVPATSTTDGLVDPSLAWDEAVERTWVHAGLRWKDLIARPFVLELMSEDGEGLELMSEEGEGLRGVLRVSAEQLDRGVCRLRVEVANTSAIIDGAERRDALLQSFVSAHVLLGIHGGEFVSLLEPEKRFGELAAGCRNVGVFPVLVGAEPERSMMLCAPIILYDYPRIAPESEGDFFDGTEMDEMLTLRVLTLTDEEKQEMRNGDERARRILERTESLTEEAMLKAHGVVRGLREIREEGQ
ncbi:MAG TPA: hypothetical protein VH250_02380 [Granulicella sp.]|nr:hypothetical protein [Granulicella sp.]